MFHAAEMPFLFSSKIYVAAGCGPTVAIHAGSFFLRHKHKYCTYISSEFDQDDPAVSLIDWLLHTLVARETGFLTPSRILVLVYFGDLPG